MRNHSVRSAFECPGRQASAQRCTARDVRINIRGDLQALPPSLLDATKHFWHASPVFLVSSFEVPDLCRYVCAAGNLKDFFHGIVDGVGFAPLMRDVNAAIL